MTHRIDLYKSWGGRNDWVARIEQQRRHFRPDPEPNPTDEALSTRRTPYLIIKKFYRVPRSSSSPEIFRPKKISIGPYHHGVGEDVKEQFLLSFLSKSNAGLAEYVQAVAPMLDKVWDAYDELGAGWDGGAFLQMMVVDGCCLLEILRRVYVRGYSAAFKPEEMEIYKHDMLLSDNQIPLEVLCVLAAVRPFWDSYHKPSPNRNDLEAGSSSADYNVDKDDIVRAKRARLNRLHRARDLTQETDITLREILCTIFSLSRDFADANPSSAHILDFYRTSILYSDPAYTYGDMLSPRISGGRRCITIAIFLVRKAVGYVTFCFLSRCIALVIVCAGAIWDMLSQRTIGGRDMRAILRRSETIAFRICDAVFAVCIFPVGVCARVISVMLNHNREPDNSFLIPSATELVEVGIGIKVKRSSGLMDISLTGTSLEIPQLDFPNIDTDFIIHNIILFERFNPSAGTPFSSYLYFMDRLIQSDEDIKLLRFRGIIDPTSHGIHVVSLIKDGSKKIEHNEKWRMDHRILDVGKMLRRQYNKKSEPWRKDLFQTYLRTPWAIISIFAAFLILCLTTVQTIYTVIAYYNPKK